jgi:hypothetical protein
MAEPVPAGEYKNYLPEQKTNNRGVQNKICLTSMNSSAIAKPQRRRTSRSNSSAARLTHVSVNNDLNMIKGAKSSKPPSIITRKAEDPTSMSRSPLFSQLHWMLNDMSPRNNSPRSSSPSHSPRSYTPTTGKRGFETYTFDKSSPDGSLNEIAPVGTSSYTPSVMTNDDNIPFNRAVRQRRDNELIFMSSSLPSQPVINTQPALHFDKVLSPPSPTHYNGQNLSLFGMEHNELETTGDAMHFSLDLGEMDNSFQPQHNIFTNAPPFMSPHKPPQQLNSGLSFSLPEFKLNTDSSMVLSEPGMFDFDAL